MPTVYQLLNEGFENKGGDYIRVFYHDHYPMTIMVTPDDADGFFATAYNMQLGFDHAWNTEVDFWTWAGNMESAFIRFVEKGE